LRGHHQEVDSMSGSQEGGAPTTSDRQEMLPISFPDQASEQRLRARLASATGGTLPVRITQAQPADVEGHAFDLASVWVRLQLEGDDTEGHAIRVQFPTAADADKFRRNVVAAGILASAIVLGSAGAIAINSNLASVPDVSAPVTTQSQYMAPAQQGYDVATGINPATGQPWRTGFQERSDGEMSGAGAGAAATDDSAVPRHPAGTVGGPLEGNE
jgi:hypothetical protein